MSIPREASRDTGKGIIISLTPDVCKTPVGSSMVAIPYCIHADQSDDANTAATVRYTGQRAHNMGSLTTQCSGDEPGTGTGVKSGTVGSVCEPKTHSASVRVQGKWAVRNTDEWWMNKRNTVGKLTWVESTLRHAETPAMDLYRARKSQLPDGSYEVADLGPLAQTMTDAGPTIELPTLGEAPGAQLPDTVATEPPGAGLPTPENPRPNVAWRLLNRIANSPMVAKEIVDYTTDGAVTRRQIENQIAGLRNQRAIHVEGGYDSGDLAQYDQQIQALEELRDQTDYTDSTDAYGEMQERVDEANYDFLDLEMGQADTRITGDETGERPDPCRIGPYSEMREVCGLQGMQAHHIVPDYTLRYGTRGEGEVGLKRITDLPSFGDGNSICVAGNAAVPGTEHHTAHTITDSRIKMLGEDPRNPVPGTVPLNRVRQAAIEGVAAAKPECRPQIEAAVNDQFGGIDGRRLLRATKYRLPIGAALEALSPDH